MRPQDSYISAHPAETDRPRKLAMRTCASLVGQRRSRICSLFRLFPASPDPPRRRRPAKALQLSSNTVLVHRGFVNDKTATDRMSDLRHEALNRQAIIAAAMEGRTLEPVYPPTSPPLSRSSMTASDDSEDDDTAYTPVHTRPGTPTALSHGARRSGLGPGGRGSGSSRTGTPSGSRSSSPTRLARKRALEEQERKTSKDPLRRFDNTVSSRIFRELDVTSLARCLRVCRRWHRSATISEFCARMVRDTSGRRLIGEPADASLSHRARQTGPGTSASRRDGPRAHSTRSQSGRGGRARRTGRPGTGPRSPSTACSTRLLTRWTWRGRGAMATGRQRSRGRTSGPAKLQATKAT